MKSNVSPSRGHLVIFAWILILAVTMVPMASAIAGTGSKSGKAVNAEGALVISEPVAKVTIQKKLLEAVITNVGDRFKVSKETIITNPEGQQVSIREMLVPCDAEISYKTEKGERVAQRIATIRIGRNSTWKWEAEIPE
ncbi:MAG: hypothetical protein P8X96_19440 [Desulfobacteraceae bacterium]